MAVLAVTCKTIGDALPRYSNVSIVTLGFWFLSRQGVGSLGLGKGVENVGMEILDMRRCP